MKTIKNSIFTTSENRLPFNQSSEIIKENYKTSKFSTFNLKNDFQNIFDAACDNIAKNEYSDLCQSFIKNHCNRPTVHNYSQLYNELLKNYRDENITFIEIGIGTNNQDVPSAMNENYTPGSSLRGWRDYFTVEEMNIYAGDVDPRILFQDQRISTHYLNQLNPKSILSFINQFGIQDIGVDFVLDDGLHEFRSNITSLITFWPYLKKSGLYLIEDLDMANYHRMLEIISSLALSANVAGYELPSYNKDDNRVIVLQKL